MHFSTFVNPDKLKSILSPPQEVAQIVDTPKAPLSATQDHELNAELLKFWNNITADAAELSWDHFYDHVSLFLDLDDPDELYV